MLFEVFVEFLVRNDGVPGERLFGGLEAECPLQLLIADVRSILIGYVSLNKRLTGNRKCKLPILRIRGDHPIGIISAPRPVLKSQVLDPHRRFPLPWVARARIVRIE